jgi:hypothetical protein
MKKTPQTPEGWACRLASLVYQVKEAHQEPKFPIRVVDLALDYSAQVFPESPISLIEGADLGGFEGMLLPHPGGDKSWGIIYDNSSSSVGRVNFTIAHEFGHYLMHREKYPEGKKCSSKDMMDWKSEDARIEGEANRFAANLLMPLDDFRKEVKEWGRGMDLYFFKMLSTKYEVSMSAAILRWLSCTSERAMIVVGRDGFIDWAWSSKPLLKSGVYYSPRKETTELPARSLAVRQDHSLDNYKGVRHPPGVWRGEEPVHEMALFTEEYNNMTISLLMYPRLARLSFQEDPPDEEDLVDRFDRWNRRD